ncbi:hypothetical protein [Paraurantiacibacter namhicola]|uniref:PepSY domain-containing protein n=1 Tax=Paraurantiacibacter namhicola TaxID=645517 RepID=A0A1C7D9Z5_9SPHN|nr:hypothetical protein [Paraurantiacibacter namhicola]ANU08284.1 hypothetical protein A6F65_01994 [Paraurantiacibacter namhicola]
MKHLLASCLAASLALTGLAGGGFAVVDAHAQSRGDQKSARAEMQAGRGMRISDIERRIVPQFPDAKYLGFEYDSRAGVYRLKFMRGTRVIWVDVDAQTARILRVQR